MPITKYSLEDIENDTIRPLYDGSECSLENTMVNKVVLDGWLTLQTVSDIATLDPAIAKALTPENTIPSQYFTDFTAMYNKVLITRAYVAKFSDNVYSCSTKQWDGNPEKRAAYYLQTKNALAKLVDDIDTF